MYTKYGQLYNFQSLLFKRKTKNKDTKHLYSFNLSSNIFLNKKNPKKIKIILLPFNIFSLFKNFFVFIICVFYFVFLIDTISSFLAFSKPYCMYNWQLQHRCMMIHGTYSIANCNLLYKRSNINPTLS